MASVSDINSKIALSAILVQFKQNTFLRGPRAVGRVVIHWFFRFAICVVPVDLLQPVK